MKQIEINMFLSFLILGEVTSNVLRLAKEARQRALGPFSPSFNVQDILLESLQKVKKYFQVKFYIYIFLIFTRIFSYSDNVLCKIFFYPILFELLLKTIFKKILKPRK